MNEDKICSCGHWWHLHQGGTCSTCGCARERSENILYVATDRAGRTWRVLERANGSFSVYYTQGSDERRFVLYDSADIWSDPPRVVLARAERAEQEARRLRSELEDARAALASEEEKIDGKD